jgi:hypothetical protein
MGKTRNNNYITTEACHLNYITNEKGGKTYITNEKGGKTYITNDKTYITIEKCGKTYITNGPTSLVDHQSPVLPSARHWNFDVNQGLHVEKVVDGNLSMHNSFFAGKGLRMPLSSKQKIG